MTVTLALHGGGSADRRACGAEHHFRTYPAGSVIRYSGTVSPIPTGTWKVKLKIKRCSLGNFVDFAKLDAQRNRHRGTFGGTFAAPGPGEYEARAELYVSGVRTVRGEDRHFVILSG